MGLVLYGRKGGSWNQVISRKYGVEEGEWYTRECREGFGVGLWKEIRKESSWLSNYIVFSVDNGRRTRFWLDSWCGDEALCNSFPSLFALAVSKEGGGVGVLVFLGLSMIGR
ncbi:hypothetical protein AAG906_012775 [Vitis piasezkii]